MLLEILVVIAGPAIFIFGICQAPKGVWQMRKQQTKNDKIRLLVKDAQTDEIKKISAQLLNGKQDDGTYLLTKIPAAINYAIGRHDWYEEQRANIFKNTLTVGGIVLAALGLYSGLQTTPSDLAKLIILGVGLTILAAVVYIVHLYNVELDGDRPYRLISDIRFWYFRYTLHGLASRIGQKPDFEKIARNELDDRTKYFDAIMEISTLPNLIREDIEQLFILHVLQRYKHESVQKMRWAFSWLIICFLAESILYYALVNFL
jgi:hypothetical protein